MGDELMTERDSQARRSRRVHVVVVDHDDDVREVLREEILHLGYRASVAKDAPSIRAVLENADVDLILLDASTLYLMGIDLVLEAAERGIRIVMISGHPRIMEEFNDRADQLLYKPFTLMQLNLAVQRALASDSVGQRKEAR